MSTMGQEELRRRASERRYAATEDRLQLAAEIALLVDEAEQYDEVLEDAAPLVAAHIGGGCVIGVLSDDGATLTPIGLDHPDAEARAALGQLAGVPFTPLGGVEDAVLRDGRGFTVELTAELAAERPGVAEYIEVTGDREAVLVPMRTRGRSIGVLWASSGGTLDDEDVFFLTTVASRLALAVDHLRLAAGDRAVQAPPSDGPASVLTAREREILALIADGMTSREIAEQLVVSIRTVEWHRARIQAKLGVSGRAELTRAAHESGLGS